MKTYNNVFFPVSPDGFFERCITERTDDYGFCWIYLHDSSAPYEDKNFKHAIVLGSTVGKAEARRSDKMYIMGSIRRGKDLHVLPSGHPDIERLRVNVKFEFMPDGRRYLITKEGERILREEALPPVEQQQITEPVHETAIKVIHALIKELQRLMGDNAKFLPAVQKAKGVIIQDSAARKKFPTVGPLYENPKDEAQQFANHVWNLRLELTQVIKNYRTVDGAADVVFAALIELALFHSVQSWPRKEARRRWDAVLHAAPSYGEKPLADDDMMNDTTH